MANKCFAGTVKGSDPPLFFMIELDPTFRPVRDGGYLLEEDFRAALETQGMPVQMIEATVQYARQHAA